ncbi:uncharacterized protein FOMMEDRAFT_148944 [Fomitiporia mediterranea MF3/22]|uniref:uncharacterized protein n=1 Tax=Fomitiporia mediterranea (strain MF3/22) TaxID=694068 RepID=UPI0004407723|nr:uncharacterized protein FOMMEDRAFT_148944 [Fomitiporia mediterranea MF3/22]EJC98983.1 hypothetical protein FOMMEDRAFT_148944 [Fomitiporia mediterranea MF3/22]
MDSSNSSSRNAYDIFNSAEQTQCDMMMLVNALDTDRDAIDFLDFGSLCLPHTTGFDAADATGFSFGSQSDSNPSLGIGDHELDAQFIQPETSSLYQIGVPQAVAPMDILNSAPQLEAKTPLSFLSPFSTAGSSPFLGVGNPSNTILGANNSTRVDDSSNALGLFECPRMFDASAHSSSFVFSDALAAGPEGCFAPTPLFSSEKLPSFSPFLGDNEHLAIGAGLPSPRADCMVLDSPINSGPSSECSPVPEPDHRAEHPSGPDTIAPECLYPSPSPTPERATVPLPRRKTRKATRKHRPSRAAARQPKSYRELSLSPLLEPRQSSNSPTGSPSTSPAILAHGLPAYTRIWVRQDGKDVEKWKCAACGQLTGRKPDMNRHLKTCVSGEKFYCRDVIHADGTIWPGCKQKFSRRDACHRHLRKRLILGRCVHKKPDQTRSRSEDDYLARLMLFQDGEDNAYWRARLPAEEKNRLSKIALSDIQQKMFR